ncbi:hypothetical protein T11_16931, partial [Trichinella zimbabwensis]
LLATELPNSSSVHDKDKIFHLMSNAQLFLFYFFQLTACLCFLQAQRPSASSIDNNEDIYKVFRFYTNTTDDLHFVLMLQNAAAKLNTD